MPKVYIAGPMRSIPGGNFAAFDKAKALGQSLGWEVYSPADMDRARGFDGEFAGNLPRGGGEPALVRTFIKADVGVIIDQLKAEHGDAIAVLPGWENSVGACGEVGLGLWAKLRFLDATTFYPIEVQPMYRTFRPPIGETCEDGMCGIMPSRSSLLFEDAERIANDPNYGATEQKL